MALDLIAKLYRKLTYFLCWLSGLLFLFVTFLVVINAVGRHTGYIDLRWASTISEYILLAATTLAAPWILHKKGHVFISFIYDALPDRPRFILEKSIYVLCIILCIGFFFFALEGMLHDINRGVVDIRAIDIPGWVLYSMFLPGFAFMTIEFFVYLLGYDSMYNVDKHEVGL